MDFFSETKFNAPIKGNNNESGKPELNILGGVKVSADGCGEALIIINPDLADENVTINGQLIIQPSTYNPPALSIDPVDRRIDVGEEIWSTKSINTSDSITATGNISTDGHISADGNISAVGNINGGSISTCGDISANGTVSGGTINAGGNISACGDITTAEGTITAKSITSQCSINTGDLTVSGFLTSGMIQANGDIIAANTTIRGSILSAAESISLAGETISSWAELKGPAGPSIQRFTSPELPANCSQFYFEGCNLVTGSELPFIQVRETATGKLVQMDVWVNLDGCCSGYTVGQPVAKIQPCSTTTEAGTWTAIVMN